MSSSTISHKPSILIVDDEPIVLAALKETLLRESYDVVATNSPAQALDILHQRQFAVIISDHRMPEMTGLEFLVEAKKLQPHTSRILITAVLSLPTIIDSINKGEIFRFLAKPWLREELTATVKNAIQRYELVTQNTYLQSETSQLNARLADANRALEAQVRALQQQKLALDQANRSLGANFDKSLDLVYRILTTYDPLLGNQIKVVTDICKRMADTEHFNADQKHVLRASAALCDIGLVGVSREFLRAYRTGQRLAENEQMLLRNHPIYGQALASFVDELVSVGETIRAHHERWDGTGYPDGLKGESIPWTARCLAVAVGYAESGLPKEQAIEHVLAQSGSGFDPEAVRLFLKVTHLIHLPLQVREIMLDDLKPGMKLANGIYNPGGLLLIGEGQELTSATIAKIRNFSQTHQINQQLLVYS
jgi:response regulator RpfG family c-di-GMP phosphodiesterase